jgi:hypothetical protein
LLESLLRAHPDDGPSRYFSSRALRLCATPEEASAGLVLRMDEK